MLLPLASVVVYARRPRRPLAASMPSQEGPGRLQRRQCLRWPTRFPVVLLVDAGPQQPLRRLPGTILDISGGGLRVRVLLLLPPGSRLQIDPEFRGPFQMAGLRCEVVAGSREGEQHYLQLAFVRLPPRVEARGGYWDMAAEPSRRVHPRV